MGLLITGVSSHKNSESGQSLLEFTLLLPVLVGITMILIRVNSAIQISIVNQQYARALTLFLAFNSPNYPEAKYQEDHLVGKQMNQMVMGVSQNVASDDGGTYSPQATIQNVSRSITVRGKNAPQEEPDQRSRVRVRNTVTLCTPTYYLLQASTPVRSLDLANNAVKQHFLTNDTKFDFCGSVIPYYE